MPFRGRKSKQEEQQHENVDEFSEDYSEQAATSSADPDVLVPKVIVSGIDDDAADFSDDISNHFVVDTVEVPCSNDEVMNGNVSFNDPADEIRHRFIDLCIQYKVDTLLVKDRFKGVQEGLAAYGFHVKDAELRRLWSNEMKRYKRYTDALVSNKRPRREVDPCVAALFRYFGGKIRPSTGPKMRTSLLAEQYNKRIAGANKISTTLHAGADNVSTTLHNMSDEFQEDSEDSDDDLYDSSAAAAKSSPAVPGNSRSLAKSVTNCRRDCNNALREIRSLSRHMQARELIISDQLIELQSRHLDLRERELNFFESALQVMTNIAQNAGISSNTPLRPLAPKRPAAAANKDYRRTKVEKIGGTTYLVIDNGGK